MLKVIHVITDTKIGGAGWWLLNFLRNYDRQQLELKVVVPKDSMLKEEIESLGVHVIELPGIGDKSLDLASIQSFYAVFKREKPSIVHTHASLSARVAARGAGVASIVHTKHCLDRPKTGWKKTVAAAINNGLSSSMTAVSEAVAQNLLDNGAPRHKVKLIYGGVDELKQLQETEIQRLRSSYGIAGEDILFGMVARLAAVKGHRYLIEAAELVAKERGDIKFILAGAGPLEEELKKLVADKGLEEKVIFTGFIKDVASIYNIIDVNMITSNSEALCLALIEGMSLGRPMIGTDVGGVPELIKPGKTGLLVPLGQPKALAEAILALAQDKELREAMGRQARQLMLEKFSASKMAEEIGRLYEELAKHSEAAR
jgi:glycosyltransferase involved in cell wall biosynthesis